MFCPSLIGRFDLPQMKPRACLSRAMPPIEKELPHLAYCRTDNVEPKAIISNAEKPRHSLNPRRAVPLIERELPNFTSARTLKVEPSLAWPKIEIEEPSLAYRLRDREEPY